MEKSKSLKWYELVFYSILVAMGIVVLGSILSGCGGMQIKNPADMTNQERALVAKSLYDRSWESYQVQFKAAPRDVNGQMSVDMKNYFQAWKKLMENAWPTIDVFCKVVEVGNDPSVDQEQQIIKLIYQLQTMLMQRVK